MKSRLCILAAGVLWSCGAQPPMSGSQREPDALVEVVDTVIFGDVVDLPVDAEVYLGRYLLLGENGTIWAVDPEGLVVDSFSLETPSPIAHALSLVQKNEMIGVWDADVGVVYWSEDLRSIAVADTLPVNIRDLFPGDLRPLQPIRGHGRLVVSGESFYVEVRPVAEQDRGAMTRGFLLRLSGAVTDTVASFQVASYASKRGDMWLCCHSPRLFSPQAWWIVRADGGLAVTDGRVDRISVTNVKGDTVGSRPLPGVSAPITRGEIKRYYDVHVDRIFEDSTRAFRNRVKSEARDRLDQIAMSTSEISPMLTQLIQDPLGRLWVRAFDVGVWPFGLSEMWSVLDPATGEAFSTVLPGMDVVLEIGTRDAIGLRRLSGRRYQIVRALFQEDQGPR